MTLKELKVGGSAVIKKVGGDGSLRQHFLDMGVIPGVEIKLEKFAPMGDPMELRIHSYELTLRVADAAKKLKLNLLRKAGRTKKTNYIVPLGSNRHPGTRRRRNLSQQSGRKTRCLKAQLLHLRLQATKTAEKQPCLIN